MENILKKSKFLRMMILIKLSKNLEMTLILVKMLGKDYQNKFRNKYKWMMTMNDLNTIKRYSLDLQN